jgi:hypothetical protein
MVGLKGPASGQAPFVVPHGSSYEIRLPRVRVRVFRKWSN